ncbi:tRNA pseudouridine(55) synthase TruB [Nitrogeniibacter aestuarii]|uniref:tRNA pseudouridine(55) synthase TruB n=1 Tax=Nitrogeniibacter aestuarii TaxID=2815343 RepID=UPI001D12A519|nr:tRNA pseudouridine(55) synthase TruB [Nitrogeniibacter aestuarii]
MNQRADRPKPLKERVDGVLLLDKPSGLSSNTALQRARRTLGAAKAGHTGTLDPLATGLLPLAFGESTKFSQSLLDADKAYEAVVRLGVMTTTGDSEGDVLQQRAVTCTAADIVAMAEHFVGDIEQMPPMFSALKHKGRPLYEYAREGKDIERKRRVITIRELTCVPIDRESFRMIVRCSKGTYVRTLAEDIGEALGCGAHLTALRRTQIGRFCIADAVSLESVEAQGLSARRLLLPVDSLIGDLPVLLLEDDAAARIEHGQAAMLTGVAPGDYRLYHVERFVGLGELSEDGTLRSRRLIAGTQGA